MKMTIKCRFDGGAVGYLFVDQPVICEDMSRPIAPQSLPCQVLFIEAIVDDGRTLHLKRFMVEEDVEM